ncbi:MAG: 4Fe-4S binding protein [Anaerolineae bacterium]
MLNAAVRNQTELKVIVDHELCCYCGACVAVCPPDAIFLTDSFLAIDQETCTACERCTKMCPVHALAMAEAAQ